ncbi:MAG TPA: putative metallopeptidase [Candidatus Saccharimonadales bacterium]|nr:putative metallopeptidase [Candidatus Saccharimonadales bacterium]
MKWVEAKEIKEDLKYILETIDLPHIKINNISCYRTTGSTSRSYARIWAFPKIFQQALQIEPHYVIEVLSKYYDRLDADEQKKVLIHELLHIPKNFSGALVPHKTKTRSVTKLTNQLFKEYKKRSKSL